ncbi:hypothetical protein DFH28DRAFT_890785, partial [Melampsora americana]
NCLPEDAEALWLLQPHLTSDNFDEVLGMDLAGPQSKLADAPSNTPEESEGTIPFVPKRVETDNLIHRLQPALDLVDHLQQSFSMLFDSVLTDPGDITPANLFPQALVWEIVKNIASWDHPWFLECILGSKVFNNQFDLLINCIKHNLDAVRSLIDPSQCSPPATNKPRRRKAKPWVPQSVEGAQLEKGQLEKEKAAKKIHVELNKKAKVAKKAQHQREKAEARLLKTPAEGTGEGTRKRGTKMSGVGVGTCNPKIKMRKSATEVRSYFILLQPHDIHTDTLDPNLFRSS